MTLMNYCGLGLFILILIIGTCIKIRSGKKVKSLEGLEGVVKKQDEAKTGKLAGQLSEDIT